MSIESNEFLQLGVTGEVERQEFVPLNKTPQLRNDLTASGLAGILLTALEMFGFVPREDAARGTNLTEFVHIGRFKLSMICEHNKFISACICVNLSNVKRSVDLTISREQVVGDEGLDFCAQPSFLHNQFSLEIFAKLSINGIASSPCFFQNGHQLHGIFQEQIPHIEVFQILLD